MLYNWQQNDWPDFRYALGDLQEKLQEFKQRSGRITGIIDVLPDTTRQETLLDILVLEAIKNSEIEGEFISRRDVASSIRHNLGFANPDKITDQNAAGMAELTLEVRENFSKTLDEAMFFQWHRMIFPKEKRIQIGQWRTHSEAMQIISGPIGREKIHFQAPPSRDVPKLMHDFILWFRQTAPQGSKPIEQAAIRAGIAHLYFESIHPFEDGNGRIGRALAEKALFQTLQMPLLISLSASIRDHRKAYYQALKDAQRHNEITAWLDYFLDMLIAAQVKSEDYIRFTLKKAQFFDAYKTTLNERQLKVIRRMLKEGPEGFQGGMTAKKYMAITQTSKATATRDLQNLNDQGVFKMIGGGRNTAYQLTMLCA